MKRWLSVLCLVLLVVLAIFLLPRVLDDGPPSILLVTMDTTRADRLGCYGHSQPTSPAIDALARDGILFLDAEAPAPLTLPSHASVLTGLHPRVHGLRDNGAGRLPDVDTVASALERAGYHTAAFVSAAPLDSVYGLGRGFEKYDDLTPSRGADGPYDPGHGAYYPGRPGDGYEPGGYQPGGYPGAPYADRDAYHAYPEGIRLRHAERRGQATVDRALRWLSTARRPFFLWVHLFEPHLPYRPDPDYPAILGDPYDAEIRTADEQVGRLVRALKDAGDLDGAAILVAGDHGEGLGDHGEDTHALLAYRSTLHVPLVLRLPERAMAGTRVDTPVALLDAGVTLAALGGATLAGPVDGHDLRDVAAGAEGLTPLLGGSYHGHRNFRWAELASWREGPLRLITGTRVELFDLAHDPGEEHDLSESRPDDVERLAAQCRAQQAQLDLRALSPGPAPVSDEALRALGYVGAGSAATVSPPAAGTILRDPRDGLPIARVLDRIKADLSEGKLAAARGRITDLLGEEAGNPFLHILLARACKGLGALDAARKALTAARQLDPGNTEILAGLIDLRILQLAESPEGPERQNRIKGILDDSRALVDLAGQSGSLWHNRARALLLVGDVEGALEALELAIDCGHEKSRSDLVRVWLRQGNRRRALQVLRQGFPGDPALAEASQELLSSALAAGALGLRDGDLGRALLDFEEALSIDANSAAAHLGLARVALARNDLPAAQDAVATGIRLAPQDPEGRVLLARILLTLGRTQDAREQLAQALALDRDHAEARTLLERLE